MNVDTRLWLTNKKKKCFSCGSLEHIATYCMRRNASGTKSFIRNKQPSTTKINEDQRHGSIGVSKLAMDAGMFIKAKVNGLNANMLVATGATVTLVSVKLFERMTSPVMTEMKREILTASGSKINGLGKTIIDIDINGYVCSNVAIVADINVDGILGLDFQRSQNCTINVANDSILIDGHKVCLQFEGQIDCYKLATAKTTKMQSRRKSIVERKVKEAGFLEKEQRPVYKRQVKEKCRLSCTQCNRDFKKAAYLRRQMRKSHPYKITCLVQVAESPMQDSEEKRLVRHEPYNEEISQILQKEITKSRTNVLEERDMFRKHINPTKRLAPIKRKAIEDLNEIVFDVNSKEYT